MEKETKQPTVEDLQKQVESLQKELKASQEEAERNWDWFQESSRKYDELKETVKSVKRVADLSLEKYISKK